jgi:hypothetical protein
MGISFFFLAGCDDCAVRLPTEMSFLDESDLPIGVCLRTMRKWVAKKYLRNIQIEHKKCQNGYLLWRGISGKLAGYLQSTGQ